MKRRKTPERFRNSLVDMFAQESLDIFFNPPNRLPRKLEINSNLPGHINFRERMLTTNLNPLLKARPSVTQQVTRTPPGLGSPLAEKLMGGTGPLLQRAGRGQRESGPSPSLPRPRPRPHQATSRSAPRVRPKTCRTFRTTRSQLGNSRWAARLLPGPGLATPAATYRPGLCCRRPSSAALSPALPPGPARPRSLASRLPLFRGQGAEASWVPSPGGGGAGERGSQARPSRLRVRFRRARLPSCRLPPGTK